jgi:outer membrane murein-binding lipoprotein Lpp
MKQEIYQARSTSLSKIDSINSDINTLNSLVDTYLESSNSALTIQKMETNLEQLAKDFDTTKTKYEIELNSKIKDIENKKENFAISKINLEELLE